MISMIRKLLHWFYCLDISTAILVLLTATIILLCLYKQFGDNPWWRWSLGIALACWAAVVIYTTVINREGAQQIACNMMPFHSYREAFAGKSEILRSNFMNVALFYPAGLIAGLLLPGKWPFWARCLLVTVLLGFVSVGIEWIQYRLMLGLCEIDDVIHNTVGAMLGSLISLRPIHRMK